MMNQSDNDGGNLIYRVVKNPEDQYSIWPDEWALPAGWEAIGFNGRKEECLAHVRTIWTDMRTATMRAYAADWK